MGKNKGTGGKDAKKSKKDKKEVKAKDKDRKTKEKDKKKKKDSSSSKSSSGSSTTESAEKSCAKAIGATFGLILVLQSGFENVPSKSLQFVSNINTPLDIAQEATTLEDRQKDPDLW